MLINPVKIEMSRHHLEALWVAAGKRLDQLKGDSAQRRVLENARDELGDRLNKSFV